MRKLISKALLEWFDVDVCWAHSAGGYRRTKHSWNPNCFCRYHCTSCGITTRKDVEFDSL